MGGIPNCFDVECLQRVLNRTQKVWNDFGGKKVAKPEPSLQQRRERQRQRQSCSLPAPGREPVPASTAMPQTAVMDFILTLKRLLLQLLLKLLLVGFQFSKLQLLLHCRTDYSAVPI